MIGGDIPFYAKFWVSDRVGAKSPIFDLFSLVCDSAVTPSEKKVQLRLIGSLLRAFQ